MKKMWHLKTITVPVIVGAFGMIYKGTDKRINSPSLYETEKLALCGTAYLLRSVQSL